MHLISHKSYRIILPPEYESDNNKESTYSAHVFVHHDISWAWRLVFVRLYAMAETAQEDIMALTYNFYIYSYILYLIQFFY